MDAIYYFTMLQVIASSTGVNTNISFASALKSKLLILFDMRKTNVPRLKKITDHCLD